jgi:hypothetical protein
MSSPLSRVTTRVIYGTSQLPRIAARNGRWGRVEYRGCEPVILVDRTFSSGNLILVEVRPVRYLGRL